MTQAVRKAPTFARAAAGTAIVAEARAANVARAVSPNSLIAKRSFAAPSVPAKPQIKFENQNKSPLYYKLPAYAAVAGAAGAGYYQIKKQQELQEKNTFEERIEEIYSKVINYSFIEREPGDDEFTLAIKILKDAKYSLRFEDFCEIIKYLKTTEPARFAEYIKSDGETMAENIESQSRSIGSTKWFLANPDIIQFLVNNIPDDYLEVFVKQDFLYIYDKLINDFRYRKTILNVIKRAYNYKKESFKYTRMRHLPKLFKYLQQDQFEHKALLILARNNEKKQLALDQQRAILDAQIREKQREKQGIAKKELEILASDQDIISNKHLQTVSKEDKNKIERSEALGQFTEALKKESQLLKKDYISFYHGQSSDAALLEDFSNMLFYKIAGEEKPQDFMFLRFKTSDFEKAHQSTWNWLFSSHKTGINNIINQQKMLIQGQDPQASSEDHLWLNLFAFGNLSSSGSFTLDYVAQDKSLGSPTRAFPDILNMFNVPIEKAEIINQKYKDLLKKRRGIYSTGRLLLIALPKDIVDDAVYTQIYEDTKHKRSQLNIAGKTMHNISDLINHLNNKSENKSFKELDTFQCVLPMTPAISLNPQSGIKIIPFDGTPSSQEDLQALENEMAGLVNEVIIELQKNNSLKAAQRKAQDFLRLTKDIYDRDKTPEVSSNASQELLNEPAIS